MSGPRLIKRRCQKTPQLGRVFSTHTALEETGIELTGSQRDKGFFWSAVQAANATMPAIHGFSLKNSLQDTRYLYNILTLDIVGESWNLIPPNHAWVGLPLMSVPALYMGQPKGTYMKKAE